MMSLFRKDFNTRLHKTQKAMQKHAQALATQTTLDYSVESIDRLDTMLEAISKEVKDTGVSTYDEMSSNADALGIAESLGCYIVECIERSGHKGKWVEDPEHPWPTYVINNGATIFPIDWILKKLVDSTEKIVPKYEKFVLSQ